MTGIDDFDGRTHGLGTDHATRVTEKARELAVRAIHRWHTARGLDPADVLDMLGLTDVQTVPVPQTESRAVPPGWSQHHAELLHLLCDGHDTTTAALKLGITRWALESRLRRARQRHDCATLDELIQCFRAARQETAA